MTAHDDPDDTPGPPPVGDTRTRLLDAANRRFRTHGYDAATAAAIAADAGVTERTFFRHFPTKADVLVANWERHGVAMREQFTRRSTGEPLLDVVHGALDAFLRGVSDELDAGLDSVVRLYTDHTAFLAIIEHLLGIEQEVAEEISRRSGRPADDFSVRVAANASMGVLRAAVRAAVLFPDGPRMLDLLDDGMAELTPLFTSIAEG